MASECKNDDGPKPEPVTNTSSVKENNEKKKLVDRSHGLRFESKLLALFCIRALAAGYKFELSKEKEEEGGKLEDLIFRYEVADDTPAGKHWRYRFLQAKHKMNEKEKIAADHLLVYNPKGDFSLPKYFHSYYKIRARGEDIQDCIICTNIGFHLDSLAKRGVELVSIDDQPEDILVFGAQTKTARYKLQINDEEWHRQLREEWSPIRILAEELKDCATKNKTTDIRAGMLNSYHVALVDENVIDCKTKELGIFHQDFVSDAVNLSEGARELRQTISILDEDNWEDWKFKLSYNFGKSQSAKSENAQKILLAGVTKMSLEYQGQLEKEIKFNDSAIQVMKKKLEQLMDSSNNKVERIATPSPQFTAVKVISALQILMQELKQDENYLVVPSSLLQDEEEMKRWENILKLKKGFHHFLVVVCDNEDSIVNYRKMIPNDQTNESNFLTIISSGGPFKGMKDEIKYQDLSNEFKNKILSRLISFQGENLTVGELVGDQPDQVIDFISMKELLLDKKEIKIPSNVTSRFEESLFIKRRVKSPIDSHIEDEIAKSLDCTVAKLREECRITPEGHIEWLVQNKRQQEIWEKMKNATNKTTQSGIIMVDSKLISLGENKAEERSVIIISGVAGTGKSTLLSHFYKEIKKKKPDHWILRINLVDRRDELMKLNADEIDVTDFFSNYSRESDNKNSFTNSLLRHRLRTGDRIVFMFDGFDEIDRQCQRNAIKLMKAIRENKSIQLYVTSRPHSVDDLQKEFFQFSYSLESFDIDDQINYLTEYWETNLTDLDIQDKSIIRKFAATLTDRVSQSLRDKERFFIGVPLQCRILGECFQLELQTIIKDNKKDGAEQTDFENQFLSNVNFDLNNLYKLLMETKRRVFRDEKANASNPNQIMDYAIEYLLRKIESHMTKLAIETLVTDKKSVDILWPPQFSYHQSETEKIKEEKTITEFGIKFGLIEGEDEDTAVKTQFLHRTFAEYLLAKYLYEGIAINHCEDNQLLDHEPVRDLIVSQIFVEDNYDGVRVFIDSMLKKTINSEKWRQVISKEVELPFRLKNFANSLAQQITAQREDDASVRYSPNLHPNPITVSLGKANLNMFFTLLGCLDRKFDQFEMNSIIRSALDKRCFSFDFFLNFGKSELFRRLIIHYNDADSAEVERIVKEMLYQDVYQPTWISLEFYCVTWYTESTKEIVKVVLDFMGKHQSKLNKIWKTESNQFKEYRRNHFSVQLLHFFTFNEYYDSLFPQTFQLLSSVYSNDCDFIKLLKFTLRMRDANNNNWAFPLNSGIEKTLTNLRDLGRYKVMEGLSHLALVSDKKVFDKFYQPFPSNMTEDCSNFPLLLENDSNRITYVVRDIELAVPYTCERFTPFYVAAACGHKEICHKILSFMKENFGIDRKADLIEDGFVYCAMWDAILFENLQMFQLILEVVKVNWGQDSLLVLLKTENSEIDRNKSWFYVRNSYTEEFEKKLLKIKVKVLLQNDSEKGYEDLSDLIFASVEDSVSYNRVKVFITLKDMEDETLQGMLSVKGLENWMKCFFDWQKKTDWKFRFLSDHLLARFTSQQISQFVDAITSPYSLKYKFYPIDISYWARWLLDLDFDLPISISFPCLEKLLKVIADNDKISERSDIQKLLFNDNGKDCTRVLLCQDRKIVSIVSPYLSRTDRIKIKKFVRKNGPEIINEIFFYSRFSDFSQQALRYWVNILSFYDDRTRKPQFEKLVQTLLLLRTEYGQLGVQYSFWSRYLDSYDNTKVEMVDKFLKLVSEKLSKRAVRKVVLHKDGLGIVLLGAELQENKKLVNVMLSHLSDQDRDCVYLLVIENSPFNSRGWPLLRLGTLLLLRTEYGQLEVQYSFWSKYLDTKNDEEFEDDNKVEMVDQFLKLVSEKLGKEIVKEVVLHEDSKGKVIFGAELQENKQLVNVMLSHLSDQDRDHVERLIIENSPFTSRK
uniref:NACHT domain-containing protein n=1 Tax=Daphnia galeata TaxID=27404 RepID=A0A8J2RQM8_9CRUS|nr:unnamed protein product [Daphnia galeata]